MTSFVTTLAFGLVALCHVASANNQLYEDIAAYNYDDTARQISLNDTSGQIALYGSIALVLIVPFLIYFLVSQPTLRRRSDQVYEGEYYDNNHYSNRYTR